MKKFKFNAVLASALSLGIVCGSPVFAAKEEVEMPSDLSQKPVPILRRQNATVADDMAARSREAHEEPRLRRQNATVADDMAARSKEAPEEPKLTRHDATVSPRDIALFKVVSRRKELSEFKDQGSVKTPKILTQSTKSLANKFNLLGNIVFMCGQEGVRIDERLKRFDSAIQSEKLFKFAKKVGAFNIPVTSGNFISTFLNRRHPNNRQAVYRILLDLVSYSVENDLEEESAIFYDILELCFELEGQPIE